MACAISTLPAAHLDLIIGCVSTVVLCWLRWRMPKRPK